MAIISELSSSYGINASYHRVVALSLNMVKKEIIICVGSYVNKDIRNNGFDPIDMIDIVVPKEDYDLFLKGDILTNAYEWLKKNVVGFEEASNG